VKELSFELPSKCAVAIVGRSGCGKSTVMKLMLRFYDPQHGVVSLDGHPLSKIRLDSLRGQVGVVLQEPALFNGSVRANIAITKPGASSADIEAAARAAEIHDDIVNLPSGYETPVGEGGKRLSLGQRQRIALARALLRDPSVLILDEITSSLDPEAESAIQTTLRRLSRQRTVVMLTHRLSSASHAERILVLDQGRLVQQGRHHSLLQEDGLYRKFWQIQSGFVVSQDGRRAQITAERLEAIPLFSGIDGDVLGRLAGCFLTEYFETGDRICAEGEVGDRFFIIVRGRVRVVASSWDHREAMQVALLEDGDYFGEESMLQGNTYTTGVEVEVPTLVLFLRRRDFKQMLKTTQRVRETMEETALARCLTLIGRRGRGPQQHSAWDSFLEGD
jgi:ATP-binding cassette subfamily B protein